MKNLFNIQLLVGRDLLLNLAQSLNRGFLHPSGLLSSDEGGLNHHCYASFLCIPMHQAISIPMHSSIPCILCDPKHTSTSGWLCAEQITTTIGTCHQSGLSHTIICFAGWEGTQLMMHLTKFDYCGRLRRVCCPAGRYWTFLDLDSW